MDEETVDLYDLRTNMHFTLKTRAFALETPIGWVAYSGDLRLHGHSKWRTEQFARELGELKPAVFIVEGTHLGSEKPTEEGSVVGEVAPSTALTHNAKSLFVPR